MTVQTPAQLADTAAEAIRALNHRTRLKQADWEYPSDAYDAVGNLSQMAMGLPQALDQIAVFLKGLQDAGHLRSDKDQLETDLAATYGGLADARAAADALYQALDRAHSGLSSIAYQD